MRHGAPVSASLSLIAFFTSVPARGANAAAQTQTPSTRPERTAHRETSRYDDVMAFVREVDAKSPKIHLTSFGYTFEGKSLPLVVVGEGLADASAEAVKKSGKTRVYIQGNIHGGEVEGKEAVQMLLRELSRGEHADWLQSLVLLFAPIYNADGNDRVRMSERNAQNGPIGGVGTRANAQDLDLNRDHMKLESPEARSLVSMLNSLRSASGDRSAHDQRQLSRVSPHLFAAAPSEHRAEDRRHAARRLAAGDHKDDQGEGWLGLLLLRQPPARAGRCQRGGGAQRAWVTFDHRPRFNNNYLGLRNRVAILSEAYSYLPYDERIAVTRRFVIEILDYAKTRAAEIRRMVEEADKASIVGQTLALRAKTKRAAEPVDILLGGVKTVAHPYTGAPMLQRTDEQKVERMPEWGTFEATDTERVPAAYLVPAELTKVIELLEAHGATVTRLKAETAIEAEEFVIATTDVAQRAFQNHRERTVTGAYRPSAAKSLPAGTVVVPMNQPLARVIFTLLEPRSDDGVVNWNVLDDLMEKFERTDGGRVYPIRRTFAAGSF